MRYEISQHERGRYWNREFMEACFALNLRRAPAATFCDSLRRSTECLLGYVRGSRNLESDSQGTMGQTASDGS